MRIGFDFDNTIVNYDTLFHKVAMEQGVIDRNIPINKIAVRNHLRSIDKEDIWTEMQGYVYGARMLEADAYPDVLNVMHQLKNAGHQLTIISHKTQYPYLGQQYDLHAAARAWIENSLRFNNEKLISEDDIFFRVTKEDKIKCIADLACDVFIDDLPEILTAPLFPVTTQRYLFDPEQQHVIDIPQMKIVSSWSHFASYLL